MRHGQGKPIHGIQAAESLPNVKVFHAGTARVGDSLLTSGGRVLGVTAWGATLEKARDLAYAAVGRIRFDGAHFRRDIGAKARQAGQVQPQA